MMRKALSLELNGKKGEVPQISGTSFYVQAIDEKILIIVPFCQV